jgi:hypothetical protein
MPTMSGNDVKRTMTSKQKRFGNYTAPAPGTKTAGDFIVIIARVHAIRGYP